MWRFGVVEHNHALREHILNRAELSLQEQDSQTVSGCSVE